MGPQHIRFAYTELFYIAQVYPMIFWTIKKRCPKNQYYCFVGVNTIFEMFIFLKFVPGELQLTCVSTLKGFFMNTLYLYRQQPTKQPPIFSQSLTQPRRDT